MLRVFWTAFRTVCEKRPPANSRVPIMCLPVLSDRDDGPKILPAVLIRRVYRTCSSRRWRFVTAKHPAFCFRYKWVQSRPNGLRRRLAAHLLLELRVRIPPGTWMSVLWVLYLVRQRSLRRTNQIVHRRPTEWVVIVCDLETSRMKRPWPALGCCASRVQFRYHAQVQLMRETGTNTCAYYRIPTYQTIKVMSSIRPELGFK
jgi:hypothetical protein